MSEKGIGISEYVVPSEVMSAGMENVRRLSEPARPIMPGDTVWWGDGSVHWIVLSIKAASTPGYVSVRLKSGLTGRQRFEVLPERVLRLYEGRVA